MKRVLEEGGDSLQRVELQFLGWEKMLERELLESEVGGGGEERTGAQGKEGLSLWLSKG